MHTVAKACAKGELVECGCEKSQTSTNVRTRPATHKYQTSSSTPSPSTDGGFEWGGCSDDLKFGRNVSMSFVDGQEGRVTRRRIVRLVNLHNNEAGRQVSARFATHPARQPLTSVCLAVG